MHRPRARVLAAAAVSALVGALVVVMGPATGANAATVTVPYRCQLTVLGVGYDTLQNVPVTITAPAIANAHTAMNITYDIAAGSTPINGPVALTNVSVVASAGVTASSTSANVSATGAAPATSPATVAAFGAFPTNLPASLSFPADTFNPGETVTIKPDVLQLAITSSDGDLPGGASMLCTPEPSPGPTGATVSMTIGPADTTDTYCPVLTTSCSLDQHLYATVTAGLLSQQVFVTGTNPGPTDVVFPPIETKATLDSVTAPFNRIQVTDTRGSQVGMSLVASAALNFTDGAGGSIPITGLHIGGLTCTPTGTGAAPANAGPGGTLDTAQTLCSTTTGVLNPQGSTSGQWDVEGTWTLDVPAYSKAAAYTTTVTFVLS